MARAKIKKVAAAFSETLAILAQEIEGGQG